MIGQMFVAAFSVFTYGLVGRFTALWFGSKEISRAGALTLFGDQVSSEKFKTRKCTLPLSCALRTDNVYDRINKLILWLRAQLQIGNRDKDFVRISSALQFDHDRNMSSTVDSIQESRLTVDQVC